MSVARLYEMEAAIPSPPNAELAVHWSAMILLLRQACVSAIEAVEVTRNLATASELLVIATKEMGAMADSINAWTARLLAGELEP